MGRPEQPIEADGPAAELARGLRALRDTAGGISYAELGKRVQYSPSALALAARGTKLPTRDVTLAFVRGCGGDERAWASRWDQANASLGGGRPNHDDLTEVRARPPKPRRGLPEVDPAAAGSVIEFVQQMRLLKLCVGQPTLRDIAREARRSGLRLPSSTLSDALRGDKLPKWRVVQAFVVACGHERELETWHQAWRRIAALEVTPNPLTGLFTARRMTLRSPSSTAPPTIPVSPQPQPPRSAADAVGDAADIPGPVLARPTSGTESRLQSLTDQDPRRVGPFDLLGRIGSGGMAIVYLARTPGGRRLAVKVMHRELSRDLEFRARFRREIAIVRQVHGLYTAPIIDADPDGEPPWIATEYIDGPSLHEFVTARGPLSHRSLIRLAAGTAEALEEIHHAGIVHRDLKPANIMLAETGPKVIDFGISTGTGASKLTRPGIVVGTPASMAPEQLDGQPVGPAADMFSLGAALYFAATGDFPFGNGPTGSVVFRAMHQEPDLEPCPPWLRPLVRQCLRKDPAERLTPADVLAELGHQVITRTWTSVDEPDS